MVATLRVYCPLIKVSMVISPFPNWLITRVLVRGRGKYKEKKHFHSKLMMTFPVILYVKTSVFMFVVQ